MFRIWCLEQVELDVQAFGGVCVICGLYPLGFGGGNSILEIFLKQVTPRWRLSVLAPLAAGQYL